MRPFAAASKDKPMTKRKRIAKAGLEQVIELAEQLSQKERLQLFAHLASLPDSQIRYLPPAEELVHPRVKEDPNRYEEISFNWHFEIQEETVNYELDGLRVLSTVFESNNFASALFEKIKNDKVYIKLPENRKTQMYDRWRELLAKEGIEVTNEQIEELVPLAMVQLQQKLLLEGLINTTKQIRARLPQVLLSILSDLTQASLYAGVNQVRDVLNVKEKYSEKEMRDALYGEHWDRIKTLLDLAPRGGARNIKHRWTDNERQCLRARYDELRPIWNEAKRIALQAQRSREKTRKANWRKEVLNAYPDLPADLLERFAKPFKGDDSSRPATMAMLQAKRECGISEEYSFRQLTEIIKARKIKN
jgi:hypothetical protein